MKLTYLNSACVIVEDKGVKVLCDPWMVNGEYFGSWGIYPPVEFKPKDFDDIDYIYISHIHPDHCSPLTLSQLNKKIPVIIYNFKQKFLKKNIERLGFDVRELSHNTRIKLKGNLHVNIFSADNCNPEICGRLFGCSIPEADTSSLSIDTMAVFDNENQIIVNTNDCPYEISRDTAKKIKEQYKKIDMLLVGYSGASDYPQCYNLSEEETRIESNKKMIKRLTDAKNYVELLEPRYFMPFAGRYTLSGKNHLLNHKRGEPDLDFAYDYLSKELDQKKYKCIGLNSKDYFDIDTGRASGIYKRVNQAEKQEYVDKILSKIKYSFEDEQEPGLDDLLRHIPKAYERLEKIRKQIGFVSDTVMILRLKDGKSVVIHCDGGGYEIIANQEHKNFEKILLVWCDPRLLSWLLQGPAKAHWNNASIGSYLQYERIPNVYNQGLYFILNYFYSGDYNEIVTESQNNQNLIIQSNTA
jgi:UDP-MurNAc hydroxylase